jgi:hypothetical protein
MITDGEGNYAIERIYSDPDFAKNRAKRFEKKGSHKVSIEAKRNGHMHIVTAWFDDYDKAIEAA